jgi:hypothetical protein
VRENPGVPLRTPNLDKRDYKQLRDEAIERIPIYAPEWTDFNESDPGLTLVELFAFLADTLLWQIDERQRRRRRRRHRRSLALLVVGMAGLGALWRTSKLLCSRPGEGST